jgi:Reverse transcriptase (RNA-dependent DNA polymerase).
MDWVEYMLENRNRTVSNGDTTTEGNPDKGCPQGGFLSPLLWCFMVNDLLVHLQKEGFLVHSYADNTAILIRWKFLNTLTDLMINVLKTVQRWYETKGLMVNLLETNVMVFTRKYKPVPTQPLTVGEKRNCLHLFGDLFRSVIRS